MIRYPRDAECALIARLAYEPVALLHSDKPLGELSDREQRILSPYIAACQDWQLIPGELGFYEDATIGYVGVAYVNHQTHQIVIAHCSKEYPVENPLKPDYQVRLWDTLGKQMIPALNYTYRVLREFQGESDHFITPHSLTGYQLSVTGHALGAFLAEITAAELFIKYQCLIHTVTFDSLGSLATIEQKLTDASLAIDKLNQLDIVTYLSSPNLVNVCNAQAGRLIQIIGNIDLLGVPPHINTWFLHTLNQTRMTGLLAAFDPALGELAAGRGRLVTTKTWPHYNFVHETSEHYQKFDSFKQALEEIEVEIRFDEEFKLTYGASPQSQALIPHHGFIAHIHPFVREFLKGYLRIKDAMNTWLTNQQDREMVALLDKYQLPPEKPDCLVLPKGMNAKQWIEQVMGRLGQHPEYTEHLAEQLTLGNSAVAKQATADYPAILTLIGRNAKVSGGTIEEVEQVVANIGADATEANLAFIQHNLDQYPIEMLRIELIGANAELTGVNIRGISQSLFCMSHGAVKSEAGLKKAKPVSVSKTLHDHSEAKESEVSYHKSEGELKMQNQNTLIGANANVSSGSNISGNQIGNNGVRQGDNSTYNDHRTYVLGQAQTNEENKKQEDPRVTHIRKYIEMPKHNPYTLNQYFGLRVREHFKYKSQHSSQQVNKNYGYANCNTIDLSSLNDCSFIGCDFSKANFERAKFNNLNLDGLNLYRTRIDGASFTGTKNLSMRQLACAKFTFYNAVNPGEPIPDGLALTASDGNREIIQHAYHIKPGEELVYLFRKYLPQCKKTGLDCLSEFIQIITEHPKAKQKFEKLLELIPQQDLVNGLALANTNTAFRIGVRV